ncbi:MAG: calcium-binding protein [Thermoleophilia bacterium]|nr:calcium-binding protein [Thermoleophilia bacterium]
MLHRAIVRPLTKFALLGAVAVLAAGCVTFNGTPTLQQAGDVAPTLRLDFSVCTNGSTGGATGGPCAPVASNPASLYTGRTLLAALVPQGSTPPALATATLSDPASVTRGGVAASHTDVRLFRSTSYETQLQAQSPAPAGHVWAGYVSEVVTSTVGTTVTGTGRITVGLPVDADGNATTPTARRLVGLQFVSPFSNATVTGTDPDPDAGQAGTLAVACTPPNCIGTTSPADGTLEVVPVRTLRVTAPATAPSVTAGGSTTAPFTVRLEGGALPAGGAVALTASTTASGVTVSAPATVTATPGTDVVATVTVSAVATAPGGAAAVKLVAKTADGSTRTATTNVTVTAATPAPPTTTPSLTQVGTAGVDYLYGGIDNDRLLGLGGNDRLYGYAGNDYLNGGTGNDALSGGTGRDTIVGGPGNDRMYGDGSRDVFSGGPGNDVVRGKDRSVDTIICGAGFDVVSADRADHVLPDCERVFR